MGTTTAIIHIGQEHQYHSGMQTELMVTLSENDSAYLNPFSNDFRGKWLFGLDHEYKEYLQEGPLSEKIIKAFEQRGITLEKDVEVQGKNGDWRLRKDPDVSYQLLEDQWEIKVLDIRNNEFVWKKQGGVEELYVPDYIRYEDEHIFYHPITDLLLTFCIKRSKAANKLKWLIIEATGEENQNWIDRIQYGVDNLSEEDHRIWKKWKDFIWDNTCTGSLMSEDRLLKKARKLMTKHGFEGKIMVVLLKGISTLAHKGITDDIEDLNTKIVLFDQTVEHEQKR